MNYPLKGKVTHTLFQGQAWFTKLKRKKAAIQCRGFFIPAPISLAKHHRLSKLTYPFNISITFVVQVILFILQDRKTGIHLRHPILD